MREKHLQNLSSYAAIMANSKYDNQKRKLEFELKSFRNYFNYNRFIDDLLEQEKY